MEGRPLFAEPGQAAGLAIGLKLFGEVLRQSRELPLFAALRPTPIPSPS